MRELTHTTGTDPEFFLTKNGKLVSAVDIIQGTKYDPIILESGSGLHYDNVAAEFSTKPHSTIDGLISDIKGTLTEMVKVLPKDINILAEPSAEFDEDQLQSEESKRFGCDPDYDAWEVSRNIPPRPDDFSMRSCGGHLHIGYVEGSGNEFLLDIFGKIDVVRTMDLFHGVISTVLDNSVAALKRKELYGKAGCYRPTEYGVEYRVLSNFWLKSPELVMLMVNLSEDVLAVQRADVAEKLVSSVGASTIQSVINNMDIKEAINIMENVVFPYLHEDSKYYINEAIKNMAGYNFSTEWGI